MKSIKIMKNGVPSKKSSNSKGNYKYWEMSVNRLGIFVDQTISPGHLVNGVVNLRSRLAINRIFKEFMSQYADVLDREKRPFTTPQEEEIKRVINGGSLST